LKRLDASHLIAFFVGYYDRIFLMLSIIDGV